MTARHLAFLVEEPSMEAFLRALLPRMLPAGCTFEIHPFQGKSDLLAKLQARLRGYSVWLPNDWRIVVIVDRDNDDCRKLKRHLERKVESSGLGTRSSVRSAQWKVVTRIAIEELEAWYFGDWSAVQTAYPRVPTNIPKKARFRNPDAINATWEAFERILQRHGYFENGLRKMEAARELGRHIDPNRNKSSSFLKLREAIIEATAYLA